MWLVGLRSVRRICNGMREKRSLNQKGLTVTANPFLILCLLLALQCLTM